MLELSEVPEAVRPVQIVNIVNVPHSPLPSDPGNRTSTATRPPAEFSASTKISHRSPRDLADGLRARFGRLIIVFTDVILVLQGLCMRSAIAGDEWNLLGRAAIAVVCLSLYCCVEEHQEVLGDKVFASGLGGALPQLTAFSFGGPRPPKCALHSDETATISDAPISTIDHSRSSVPPGQSCDGIMGPNPLRIFYERDGNAEDPCCPAKDLYLLDTAKQSNSILSRNVGLWLVDPSGRTILIDTNTSGPILFDVESGATVSSVLESLSPQDGSWSPNGEFIALSEIFGPTLYIYHLPTDHLRIIPLQTAFGPRIEMRCEVNLVSGLSWSSDSRHLSFLSNTTCEDRNDNSAILWIYDVLTTDTVPQVVLPREWEIHHKTATASRQISYWNSLDDLLSIQFFSLETFHTDTAFLDLAMATPEIRPGPPESLYQCRFAPDSPGVACLDSTMFSHYFSPDPRQSPFSPLVVPFTTWDWITGTSLYAPPPGPLSGALFDLAWVDPTRLVVSFFLEGCFQEDAQRNCTDYHSHASLWLHDLPTQRSLLLARNFLSAPVRALEVRSLRHPRKDGLERFTLASNRRR